MSVRHCSMSTPISAMSDLAAISPIPGTRSAAAVCAITRSPPNGSNSVARRLREHVAQRVPQFWGSGSSAIRPAGTSRHWYELSRCHHLTRSRITFRPVSRTYRPILAREEVAGTNRALRNLRDSQSASANPQSGSAYRFAGHARPPASWLPTKLVPCDNSHAFRAIDWWLRRKLCRRRLPRKRLQLPTARYESNSQTTKRILALERWQVVDPAADRCSRVYPSEVSYHARKRNDPSSTVSPRSTPRRL